MIARANDTKYGLAAGVVTKSLDTANTLSRALKAGTIWVSMPLLSSLHLELQFMGIRGLASSACIGNAALIWVSWLQGTLLLCRVFVTGK